MYRIIIFISLLLTHVSHGSNGFTQEDSREIMDVKRKCLNYNRDQYQKFFGEPWNTDSIQPQYFRLKSGIDIEISLNILNILNDSAAYHNDNALKTIFNPMIGEDFQQYSLPKEFIENGHTPFTVQLRRKYGKVCDEKFDKDNKISVKFALLHPDKTVYIKDKHYKISVDNSSLINIDLLKKLLLTPDDLGFGYTPIKMNFRYMSPNNEGIRYGLFLRTENKFLNDLGQEELIGAFIIEQVLREF